MCASVYTVYTCLSAKGIIALIMHLLADAGNKDLVSTMGSDGSEIRFHPRFKAPEGAANNSDVFVFRVTLLGEITPRYGRNLAVLRAEKALGDVAKRVLDVTMIGYDDLEWNGERERVKLKSYACTGCIDLWETSFVDEKCCSFDNFPSPMA